MLATKSEGLLSKIGQLVECEICHQRVLLTNQWMMTAKRDEFSDFYNKKAVCPICQSELAKNGELLVTL